MSRAARCYRGATLIEIILAVAIASILLAATVSMLFVAQRAVASGSESASRLSQESAVMQTITTDLSLAISFTERTDRAMTLTVPDRTDDGVPETIRYAWSGVAGEPLTRQINGGPVVVIAPECHQFRLSYLLKTLAGGD